MRRLAAPAALLGVGLVLLILPVVRLPAFYESFLYLVFHWVALATSWSILSGFSGYFSFGHGAFFGAGMYADSDARDRGGTVPDDPAGGRAGGRRVGARDGGIGLPCPPAPWGALRTAHARRDVRPRHDRAQHPHRRRPRRVPERGAGAADRRLGDGHALPARARRRGGRRRGRLRDLPGPLGRRALRHSRRRGRGGGAGRAHLSLQAPGARRCLGPGRRGRWHPRDVRDLRHRGRDVLDRGASLRDSDERGRRRPALARSGDRRGTDHGPDVRRHRRPDGRRRARGGRAHARCS